jgi:hypothetical protein
MAWPGGVGWSNWRRKAGTALREDGALPSFNVLYANGLSETTRAGLENVSGGHLFVPLKFNELD